MRNLSLAIGLLVFMIGAGALEATAQHRRWLITDGGAKVGAAVLNTSAIQSVIDRCAASGGGIVVVSRGEFVTGALFFKPRVDLLLEDGAVLKGSTESKDYPEVLTRWEGKERLWISALVNFIGVDHARIEGVGTATIDGSGDVWTAQDPRRPSAVQSDAKIKADLVTRGGHPRLIAFQNCRDVKISHLQLKNQASWGVFFLYCEDVLAENLLVRAEHNIPSSDGMDIDSCRGVRVTACDFDVNDDDISIKSGKDEEGRRINRPSENILIEKTRFGYGHGGVAIGSEVSGGIRNIEVRDCLVEADNWAPIRIKSQPSRGGLLENIVYRNIEIRDARKAVEIDLAWRLVGPAVSPAPVLTRLKQIRLINVHGKVRSVGTISGLKEAPVEGVSFEDCDLIAAKGLVTANATSIDTTGLRVTGF